MDVNNHNFEKLKEGLPKQYARFIASQLPELTASQVRNVFNGVTTNPDTVLKVVNAAKAAFDKNKKIKTTLSEIGV